MDDEQRSALIDQVRRALWRLDGTALKAVALITGMDESTLQDMGGLDE